MPKCPQCGGELRLKTARTGRNAGGQFWGCSNWKKVGGCKFAADKDDFIQQESCPRQDEAAPTPPARPASGVNPQVPIPLNARAKFRTHRARFFQSQAMPRSCLLRVQSQGDAARLPWERNSAWRLDSPASASCVLQEGERGVLQVAMKILTRGRLTTISPRLERTLAGLLGADPDSAAPPSPRHALGFVAPPSRADLWFDGPSGTEEKFYWQTLPDVLGGSSFRYATLPQVQFSSLMRGGGIDAALLSQRVDFLVTTADKRIVVELNGPDHDAHVANDEARMRMLTAAGFEVLFIRNEEVHSGVGAGIQRLRDLLSTQEGGAASPPAPAEAFAYAIRLAHQLQVSVVEALLQGLVGLDGAVLLDQGTLLLPDQHIRAITDAAMGDLREMLGHLGNIYGCPLLARNLHMGLLADMGQPEAIRLSVGPSRRLESRAAANQRGDLVLTYDDTLHPSIPTACIQDFAFDGLVAFEDPPSAAPPVKEVLPQDVTYFLTYLFGHEELREGQFEAVSRAMTGKDAIVLLPTGHGKSAAFQLASMLMPGVTIVIDPILSLIDDQIDNLRKAGIDRAVGISSQIEDPDLRSDIIAAFGKGEYLFCYVAPERFQTSEFRNTLRTLTVGTPVALLAIDEAHCVSEWGHDFRTAYLNIGRTSREYCRDQKGRVPPLLALTGTASHAVLKDVQRELQIEDFEAIITPRTFDRQELRFAVFRSRSAEKMDVLKGILKRWMPDRFGIDPQSFFEPSGGGTRSGIVFCPFVGTDFGVMEVSSRLSGELQRPVGIYSGKPPRNWARSRNWVEHKKATAHGFKNNAFPLLVATKSFGMGIDKPNIRYTVHFGIPVSIESFYQEAGRAGRDRRDAYCCVIVSNDNQSRTDRLLAPQATPEQIAAIMSQERDWDSDDDVTRAMYFHAKAFRGVKAELADISSVVGQLGDLATARRAKVVAEDIERSAAEKAIHRLLVLGVVRDYTIDYSANEFGVQLSGITKAEVADTYARYVQGYNRGRVASERGKLERYLGEGFHAFVSSACRILIEFVYDTIERGRRRALREMLSLSEETLRSDAPDATVRERLLRYLETTYSREIEDILSETDKFDRLIGLVDGKVETTSGETIGGLRSPKDAMEIRGQAARYLESYPDHPGLLTLRAIAEAHCHDCSIAAVVDNLHAAANFAIERYNVEPKVIADLIAWSLARVFERQRPSYGEVASHLVYHRDDPILARLVMASEHLYPPMLCEPAAYLMGRLCERIDQEIVSK